MTQIKWICFFSLLFFFKYQLLSQNSNIVLRSHLPYSGQSCANIWGYVDSLGNEYALVGARNGLSIVNVTDPDHPLEVIQIPGPYCKWREIKTSGHYAYVTTECQGKGVQIIDLSKLPSSNITSKFWIPVIQQYPTPYFLDTLTNFHSLHIDNNYAYLYGNNASVKGVVIANLNNPWNPTIAGYWDKSYIHDGYVRNNKIYGGHISDGYFSIIDVTNKANPVLIQTQQTPTRATHNTWLTDDSKTLLTTDENLNSFLASYDISDINNINLLDKIQCTPGSGSVVHNTHVRNDWAVTSWYRDGVNIVDVHRPQNLVQVGWYDTYADSGAGFSGTWGVYPFLPSGNLIVSNIEDGLFVLSPTYKRACYLEGIVKDSSCGLPLNNVTIEIAATGYLRKKTDIDGNYKTGYHQPGIYSVTFSKPGYIPKTINGVNLSPGNITLLDIKLYSPTNSTINGKIQDTLTKQPIQGVTSVFNSPLYNYSFSSDALGTFSRCDFIGGTYDMVVGKWGYETFCSSNNTIDAAHPNVKINLKKGYYDDFSLNFGWTSTATTVLNKGAWTRAIPISNGLPSNDITNDCLDYAYITGNNNQYDSPIVGNVELTSPVFDLTSYTTPYINYYRWFLARGNDNSDTLLVSLSNGDTTVIIESIVASDSNWVQKSFLVSNYIIPTAHMQIKFYASDNAPYNFIVEAGIDKFWVDETGVIANINNQMDDPTVLFKAYPNPFTSSIHLKYDFGLNKESKNIVQLIDIFGRELNLIELKGNSGEIEIKNELSKGVYFLKLLSDATYIKTIKILKIAY